MPFPTFTDPPSYPIDPDGDLEDARIKTPAEAGYVHIRPKFTRARRSWGLNYIGMSDTDVATLRTWEQSTIHNGSDAFSWTHPLSGTTYTVQLGDGLIHYKRQKRGGRTNVSFLLVEV